MKIGKWKISLLFRWYDFYVGWFWDQKRRILYLVPLPMIVIRIGRYKTVIGKLTNFSLLTKICSTCGDLVIAGFPQQVTWEHSKNGDTVYAEKECRTCGDTVVWEYTINEVPISEAV